MMREPTSTQWSFNPDVEAEARVTLDSGADLVLQIRARELWAAIDHPSDAPRFNDVPMRANAWPWDPDSKHYEVRTCLAVRVERDERWGFWLRGYFVGRATRDEVAKGYVSLFH